MPQEAIFKPILPPIRRLLLPDSGWVLVDADFDRADAQIVAWTADEPGLKTIFQQGIDVHAENGVRLGLSRQVAKNVLHATHYGARANTISNTYGISRAAAAAFHDHWFRLYPGVKAWHERTKTQLRLQHYIKNVWGFRRFYFDRLNTEAAIDTLLPQALAWQGQSGVAIAINHAMKQVRTQFSRDEVRLRLQVHDSLLLMVREELVPTIFTNILQAMRVRIPFDDPLYIPVSLKWSASSWGDVKPWKE